MSDHIQIIIKKNHIHIQRISVLKLSLKKIYVIQTFIKLCVNTMKKMCVSGKCWKNVDFGLPEKQLYV